MIGKRKRRNKGVPVYKGICMYKVGQNRIYTPYMTVHLVISLPKIQYINRIYMVLANPMYVYTVPASQNSVPSVSCHARGKKWCTL
jgi:hypothetical protein